MIGSQVFDGSIYLTQVIVTNSQCPGAPGPVIIVGTSISVTAFYYCQTITSVVILSTVTSIGNYYFYNSYNILFNTYFNL